jgi:LysM repeat protein
MASMKRGLRFASMLVLVAMVAAGCDLRYSTPPAATSTAIGDQSLFAPTLGPASMTDVQGFATQTALALSGTPNAAVVTATPGVGEATVTPTSIITIPTNAVTTPTSTLAVAVTNSNQVVNTSVPVGSRPTTYTLQTGEFPYCIARRFDVDPDQLLTLNGLVDGQTLYAGAVLKIPQSGSFPGTRALRNHPATYTASAGDTLYSIACLFGDVDPSAIASANGLSTGATLSAGQQISIP